jgi:hypothetical protein
MIKYLSNIAAFSILTYPYSSSEHTYHTEYIVIHVGEVCSKIASIQDDSPESRIEELDIFFSCLEVLNYHGRILE